MKVTTWALMPLLIAGCTPAQSPPQAMTEVNPVTETKPPARRAMPGIRTTAAIQQLAGRLGVAPESISVVEARAVTWTDGSLGCPEPGMMYTQALVPGELIVLEVAGRRYRFHSSLRGEPFECPEGRAQEPGGQSDLVAQ